MNRGLHIWQNKDLRKLLKQRAEGKGEYIGSSATSKLARRDVQGRASQAVAQLLAGDSKDAKTNARVGYRTPM
jgi:hypothetical protein